MSSRIVNPAEVLMVIRNTFGAMSAGPTNLKNSVAFCARQINPPVKFDIDAFFKIINESAVTPEKLIFGDVLAGWDYEEIPVWANGTRRNTVERRERIYKLLGLTARQAKLCSKEIEPCLEIEQVVVIAEKHSPWYTPERQTSRKFYWEAYKKYLKDVRRWEQQDLLIFDESTRKLVERLADPEQDAVYKARGLVVGYVQSGKTAHFTGVIARAADAGYRLFIILAGTMNILRQQTQRRIDKELIGKEMVEKDYINDRDWEQFISHGGMPSERGIFDWERLTGPGGDYRSLRQGIMALRYPRRDEHKPLYQPENLHSAPARVMIVKKTPSILEKIATDLARVREKKSEIPALIIDDESDLASINTRPRTLKEEQERTGTNKAILKLLRVLPRAQYVGYTATPYANVFIDPADAEDLFPKDFIISLPRPEGYMGVGDFYDLGGGEPEGFSSNKRAFVREVVGSDRDDINLPRAIDSWILTGAVKLYRMAKQDTLQFPHHTMLIHHSHMVNDHKEMANLAKGILEENGYSTARGLGRLRRLWEEDIALVIKARNQDVLPVPRNFEGLKPFISQCLNKLEQDGKPVLIVNKDNVQDTPDFDRAQVWKIIVGGTKLSRGYTLEGLTVSYYRRKTAASDTLMQMGRWFGYRKGYSDLVRLYIGTQEPAGRGNTVNLYLDFEGICRDEMEFREEIERYAIPEHGDPITPKQVPPLVSSRRLPPTAKNKMFNAIILFRNFGREQLERTQAPVTSEDIKWNQEHFEKLLKKCLPLKEHELSARKGGKEIHLKARIGVIRNDDLISYLKEYHWLENPKQLQYHIEFLEKKGGQDPEIDQWVFFAPIGPVRNEKFTSAKETFNIFHRSRIDEGRRFKVYSEPDHIDMARHLVMVEKEETISLNSTTRSLRKKRQGIFLFYPVQEPLDARERRGINPVTIGFVLIFPDNHAAGQIRFGLRDPRQPDNVVISSR